MKFKDFKRRYKNIEKVVLYCGSSGLEKVIYCEDIIKEVENHPFWKREKYFNEKYKKC